MTQPDALVATQRFAEQYAALIATYPQLPSLAQLDQAFDMSETICRERTFTTKPLAYTSQQMMRWLNGWTSMVHDLIMPNPQNAIALEEAAAYTENERVEAIAVLNWFMYCNRRMNLFAFTTDDHERVAFIVDVFNEWKHHAVAVRKLVEKNKQLWDEKMRGHKPVQHRSDYTN